MFSPSSIRRCFSILWNRQFLIFLFFLALSAVFWLFQALGETYEEDFQVPIELKNVPGNVVITTDLPQALHVSLRDKGSLLMDGIKSDYSLYDESLATYGEGDTFDRTASKGFIDLHSLMTSTWSKAQGPASGNPPA